MHTSNAHNPASSHPSLAWPHPVPREGTVTAVSGVGSIVLGPSILVSGVGTVGSVDVGDETSVGGIGISQSTEESHGTSTKHLRT